LQAKRTKTESGNRHAGLQGCSGNGQEYPRLIPWEKPLSGQSTVD